MTETSVAESPAVDHRLRAQHLAFAIKCMVEDRADGHGLFHQMGHSAFRRLLLEKVDAYMAEIAEVVQ